MPGCAIQALKSAQRGHKADYTYDTRKKLYLLSLSFVYYNIKKKMKSIPKIQKRISKGCSNDAVKRIRNRLRAQRFRGNRKTQLVSRCGNSG